jgi:hypothetical protein
MPIDPAGNCVVLTAGGDGGRCSGGMWMVVYRTPDPADSKKKKYFTEFGSGIGSSCIGGNASLNSINYFQSYEYGASPISSTSLSVFGFSIPYRSHQYNNNVDSLHLSIL